jgi:hypothetical protein
MDKNCTKFAFEKHGFFKYKLPRKCQKNTLKWLLERFSLGDDDDVSLVWYLVVNARIAVFLSNK